MLDSMADSQRASRIAAAEARRQKVLARGGDRLAKITGDPAVLDSTGKPNSHFHAV